LNYADQHRGDETDTAGDAFDLVQAPSSLLPHTAKWKSRFGAIKRISKLSWRFIGRRQRMFGEQARDFIFGYTIALDISDRDLQKSRNIRALQIVRHPTRRSDRCLCDIDVGDLPVEFRQNGEVRQKARTSQMIYSVSGNYFLREHY